MFILINIPTNELSECYYDLSGSKVLCFKPINHIPSGVDPARLEILNPPRAGIVFTCAIETCIDTGIEWGKFKREVLLINDAPQVEDTKS